MVLSQYAAYFDSFWCIAFVLGLRHGVDADHLAAIDGMARLNMARQPVLARNAGVLFSCGHALVVLCAALLVSSMARARQLPPALRDWGAWLSAAILGALALLNLALVVRVAPDQAIGGWRSLLLSRMFPRLLRADKRWTIAGVGALFALSFDTLGIASLLGLGASGQGGWVAAALTSGAFFAGMLVTDGINGALISRLLRGTGGAASLASRLMALTVAAVSLLTAGATIGAALFPELRWAVKEMPFLFSAAIVLVVPASFMIGRGWQRRQAAHAAPVSSNGPR